MNDEPYDLIQQIGAHGFELYTHEDELNWSKMNHKTLHINHNAR